MAYSTRIGLILFLIVPGLNAMDNPSGGGQEGVPVRETGIFDFSLADTLQVAEGNVNTSLHEGEGQDQEGNIIDEPFPDDLMDDRSLSAHFSRNMRSTVRGSINSLSDLLGSPSFDYQAYNNEERRRLDGMVQHAIESGLRQCEGAEGQQEIDIYINSLRSLLRLCKTKKVSVPKNLIKLIHAFIEKGTCEGRLLNQMESGQFPESDIFRKIESALRLFISWRETSRVTRMIDVLSRRTNYILFINREVLEEALRYLRAQSKRYREEIIEALKQHRAVYQRLVDSECRLSEQLASQEDSSTAFLDALNTFLEKECRKVSRSERVDSRKSEILASLDGQDYITPRHEQNQSAQSLRRASDSQVPVRAMSTRPRSRSAHELRRRERLDAIKKGWGKARRKSKKKKDQKEGSSRKDKIVRGRE